MAGQNPMLIVRVAATIEELKKNLAEGVNQIETTTAAMGKLAASFSGDKLVQQANNVVAAIVQIGGISKLTDAEQARVNATLDKALDKYAALGKTAPPGMQAIADATRKAQESTSVWTELMAGFVSAFTLEKVIEKVFEFASSAVEATARLEDLKLATGISTDGLQRFGYVGKEFGIDLQTMARGVEQFSAKLANGDANATKAVEMLGLSVKTLIAAGPEEAFLKFAEAAGRVEDPMLKSGLATDALGGRLAKTLLPLLGELRQKIKDVPTDVIINPENVKVAHDFEVGLQHLTDRLKSWTVSVVGSIFTWEHFGISAKTAAAATDEHTKALADNQEKIPQVITAADLLANRLSHLRADAIVPLSDAQKDEILELEKYGVAHKEIAALVGTTEIAVKLYTDAHKAAAAAAKEAARVEAAAVFEVTKLWDEYFKLRVEHHGTTNQIAMAGIEKWAADLTAKMVKAGTDTREFYTGLAAVSKEKMAAVGNDFEAAFKSKSIPALRETADNALRTYNSMAASGQFFRKELDEQLAKYHDLDDAARGYGQTSVSAHAAAAAAAQKHSDELAKIKKAADDAKAAMMAMGNTLDIGHAARDPEVMALLHQGWSLENAMALKFAHQWGFQAKTFSPKGNPESQPDPSERVPGYKFGGVGDFGSGTLAMLHGREAIVPLDGPGAGGGVGIGATIINHHYYITQPFGTPTDIAAAIDAAIMKRQRDIGVRY